MPLTKSRTPLAWLNLIHDPKRLLLAIAGTGFAVMLMFMQLGFRGALFDSTLQLPRVLNADLILLSPAKNTMSAKELIPSQRLVSARGCPGVEAVWPFYILYMRASWRNPQTGEAAPIAVYAFDPRNPVLNLPELREHADELLQGSRIMFDRRSKKQYGFPQRGTSSTLSDEQVEVVGTYDMGTDFISDGNLLMSDLLYRQLFFPPLAQDDALSSVDLGLVKLAPGSDLETVRRELRARLESDTAILTKDEFVAQEQHFWQTATPIGYIFGFGVALGFFVGVVICYQILYADIADHLPEYATLKAMGYQPTFFVSVVLTEALIIAGLGFLPGFVSSLGLYHYLNAATGLPMILTAARALLVLGMTIGMCGLSGCFTIRGLLATDPAELFK
ncbi:MAG: hypothetical protein JNM18_12660 [Planctomycetaceae bacterium]|nr:hypothetical protein [Planctomycetaceae bacterium]